MKTIFVTIISLLFFQSDALKANSHTNSSLTIVKAEIQVNGLTCSMCNLSVYKALKSLDFIDSIQTQLNSAVYKLSFKPRSIVDPGQLKKQIESAGFSVGKLELFFLPINEKIESNTHLSYGDFYFHVLTPPSDVTQEFWKAEIKDKKFISAKEFNTIRKGLPAYSCYVTGITGACCAVGVQASKSIYHLSF